MSDTAEVRPPLRILLITTAYGASQTHAPLVESLAEVLAADGHLVRVAGIDWPAAPNGPVQRYREPSGVDVLLTAPREIRGLGRPGRLLGKWLLSSRTAVREIDRAFGDMEYDLVFVMTPAVALWAVIRWAVRRSKRSYAYITDFFPYHHASIGLVPKGLPAWAALKAETALLRLFDTLAVMSDYGAGYLRRRYAIGPDQRVDILRLWTEGGPHDLQPWEDVRRRFELPLDKRIAVFSGQITDGKGVEDILATAALARDDDPDLVFLFVGKGRLDHLVKDYIAAGGGNVLLRSSFEREDFLDVISSCDVGLVAVVSHVDVPTFPSKSIDYLKAGLAIVASVESTTDFGLFVDEQGFGLAVDAGNPAALLGAVRAVAHDSARREEMRAAGRKTLTEIFTARRAADEITGLPSPRDIA